MAVHPTPVFMEETSNSLVWMRSCEKETAKPLEGKVKGNIPAWLNGRLTRNGPGKTRFGDTHFKHLFDMSALIHQFTIQDGQVTYQSRFLQGDTYKKNLKANRIVVNEFGTAAYPDPCKTLFQRFMTYFKPLSRTQTDNCLVSVCHFGDQVYALTETSVMRRIDPETLNTVGGKTMLEDYIAVNTATAHPHVDPDGTIYNMGSSFAGQEGPHYCIIKFPPPAKINGKMMSSLEQASLVTKIPCQWRMYPSYYHSFGITENYFIFVEQPLVIDLKKFLVNSVLQRRSILDAIKWCNNEKTRFHVIRRDTGQIVSSKYVSEAIFIFHHTNAFEEDGHLVVDVCAIRSGEVVAQFMVNNLSDSNYKINAEYMSLQQRYVLPLHTDRTCGDHANLVTLGNTECAAHKLNDGTIFVQGQAISHSSIELPRINYKYNGKPYTFAYGVEVCSLGIQFSRLVKMNVRTGETQHWHEEGRLVSEPVFVAAPNSTRESEGVVLATLLDKNDPRFVALLVLDPRTWKEVARVEFAAQGKVTQSFHGQFAAAADQVHIF